MDYVNNFKHLRRMIGFGLFGGFGLACASAFQAATWLFYAVALPSFASVMWAVYSMHQIQFQRISNVEYKFNLRQKLIKKTLPKIEIDPETEEVHWVKCHGLVTEDKSLGHLELHEQGVDRFLPEWSVAVTLTPFGYQIAVRTPDTDNPYHYLRLEALITRVPHPDDVRREEDKYWEIPWVVRDEYTRDNEGVFDVHPTVERKIINIVRTDSFFRLR